MNDFIKSLHDEFQEHEVPYKCEGYRIKKIPCCYLLSSHEHQHVLKMNETSLLVWELCNGSLNVGEILDLVTDQFPESASSIKRDVFRRLDEFHEEIIITFS